MKAHRELAEASRKEGVARSSFSASDCLGISATLKNSFLKQTKFAMVVETHASSANKQFALPRPAALHERERGFLDL